LALSASGLIAGENEVKGAPWSEGEPEEGEGDVLVLAPAVAVLAIDDPRLVGVKTQANLPHPRGDLPKHVLGLRARRAVHDRIVGVALERTAREVADHPRVERVVHEQVRQDRRNRRSLRSSLLALLKGAVGML
jgi:hypothetical protein